MLIVGAKGFAKEVLEILHQLNQLDNLVFYDDVNAEVKGNLFDQFSILKTTQEALSYFTTTDNRFTIGIGNPVLRKIIYDRFIVLGGVFTSTISESNIGNYDVFIGTGSNILSGATISNSVKIGVGAILYYNSIITHDCVIGDFVELSPGATILGRCKVGDYCQIGANATILPDLNIGKNVIVGVGAVVTKDIPDNSLVVGIPGKIIKQLEPLQF
ncbi:acetyltransferase [Flavobacterium sp.]|uniref:acetyltransferase n=1 Tax=Flavobacterium sp. TaxID=239 RepID=UPI003D120751